MNIQEKNIIGELVAQDYRTASVFKKFGIDFCCQGNRSIAEVCEKQEVNIKEVVAELNAVLNSNSQNTTDYQKWSIDLLADYIEKKHHRYVESKISEIKPFLDKICKVHGENHTELFEIQEHFIAAAGELAKHMKKEELILFPFVRKLVQASQNKAKVEVPQFGTVQTNDARTQYRRRKI